MSLTEHRSNGPSAPPNAMPMPGHCVLSQDGRTAILAPGEFAVLDASRPYELAFEGIRWVLVAVAPAELTGSSPAELSCVAIEPAARPPMQPRTLPEKGRLAVTGRQSAVQPLTPSSDLLRRIHRHMED